MSFTFRASLYLLALGMILISPSLAQSQSASSALNQDNQDWEIKPQRTQRDAEKNQPRSFSARLCVLCGLTICTNLPWSDLAPQHSADETALRALAEAYFHTWAAKDLDGFLRLWSDKSTELEARRKGAQELFAGSEKIELRNLTIRAVKVEGANARVRVETDARVTEVGIGKEKAGYGKTLRTLECVKEGGHWKVRGEASTYDEIGAA